MSQTPVLEVRDLGRRFGGLHAVSQLSFSVPAGQVLGVIGPNGAGKSTFVDLVTGHTKPTSGQVLIGGADLTGARPWRIASAGVARTFQIVKPFTAMTVRENIAVGIMYGPRRVRTAMRALVEAGELLERVGLSDRGEASPGELAVADARRLELAKALALRPRLLLLDEVMAGLRPGEIEPSLELIRSLAAEEGMTVLVIEHVMRAIVAVSDRVVVLHGGQLLTEGPPADVLADPRVIEAYLGHRYAAREKE